MEEAKKYIPVAALVFFYACIEWWLPIMGLDESFLGRFFASVIISVAAYYFFSFLEPKSLKWERITLGLKIVVAAAIVILTLFSFKHMYRAEKIILLVDKEVAFSKSEIEDFHKKILSKSNSISIKPHEYFRLLLINENKETLEKLRFGIKFDSERVVFSTGPLAPDRFSHFHGQHDVVFNPTSRPLEIYRFYVESCEQGVLDGTVYLEFYGHYPINREFKLVCDSTMTAKRFYRYTIRLRKYLFMEIFDF